MKQKNVADKVQNEILDEDFRFVQQNTEIRDQKFETQPTTYFKDAMKRFAKNKASVAAGCLLGILTLMAIFVPILDTNDIVNDASEYRFLPPRWFSSPNAWGFMDGTIKVKNVVLDVSDPENPVPTGDYNSDYVVGEIRQTISEDNVTASEYGWGGVVSLNCDSSANDVTFLSPFSYLNTSMDYSISMDLSRFNHESEITAEYQISALVLYDSSKESEVILKETSSEYGIVRVENVSQMILAARPEESYQTSFQVSFAVTLKTNPNGSNSEGTLPSLYIAAFEIENRTDETDDSFADIGFTSGNEVLYRELSNARNQWDLRGYGSSTLRAGCIARGTFRYNKYEEVFGEVQTEVDIYTMNDYISKGYCSYDYSVGVESFEILDDARCPVREVLSQYERSAAGVTTIKLVTVISKYREKGYTSMPKYIFGTNNSGFDYFKLLFTGLRTSLILGVIVSAICIVIGIIWGAVSGYFGGTVDLVMERFSEILGGIPYIVIVSLCILHLGDSFGVFILALTLTGWIGTASGTRSQFYRYKGREYVLASRTLGASDSRLIFKHILPNSIGPIVTSAVLMIPSVVFTESTLSYLGLGFKGLQSFGTALSKAQEYINTAPYLIISGSIIVSLLMISFNLMGNGLRDAFNPSLKGVE